MPATKNQEDARQTTRVLTLAAFSGDVLAAICLFLMMMVTFVDVIGRSVFNQPLSGATELTELFVAGAVCCALPSLTLRGRHVTIDIIDFLISERARSLLNKAGSVLGVVSFVTIAWRMWIEAGNTARFGGRTPLLEIPMAPVLYAMSVLAGLTAIAFLVRINRKAGEFDD